MGPELLKVDRRGRTEHAFIASFGRSARNGHMVDDPLWRVRFGCMAANRRPDRRFKD
jgi:hypothetical protein